MTKFIKQFSSTLLLLIITLSAGYGQPVAAPGSGAGQAGGKGFDCAPGGGKWQVVDGVARCTKSPGGAPPETPCAALNYTSGACVYNIRATASRSTTVTANSTENYSGQVTATCSAGTWGGFSASCGGNPCAATTVNSGSCSYNLPGTSSGTSVTGANTVAGYTGSMTAACSAGSFSVTSSTCNAVPKNCAAGVASWGNCTGNVGATVDGGTATATNLAAGFSGSADFTCSNGSWMGPYSPTCNANPVCPAAPATTQTNACPTGYTGNQTSTRTATCDASTGYSWNVGSWAIVRDTCQPQWPLDSKTVTITVNGFPVADISGNSGTVSVKAYLGGPYDAYSPTCKISSVGQQCLGGVGNGTDQTYGFDAKEYFEQLQAGNITPDYLGAGKTPWSIVRVVVNGDRSISLWSYIATGPMAAYAGLAAYTWSRQTFSASYLAGQSNNAKIPVGEIYTY